MAKKKEKLTKEKSSSSLMMEKMNYDALVDAIASAHEDAQLRAAQAVNITLTIRNWLIGYFIFEYEQHGQDRAKYGEHLIDNLVKDLRRLGRGFSRRNLFMFREFYLRYPIVQSVIAQFGIDLPSPPSVKFESFDWQDEDYFTKLFTKITWTHFIEIIRIDDPLKRSFYELEILQNHWSVRELKRQLNSLLYERVGLSHDKEGVLKLAQEGEIYSSVSDIIRDPYVFEFLGLKKEELYTESQLEKALLDRIQEFLLELGKGFCFIARQLRVTFDNEHYYIDLLLYNRKLRCLFAIDLILGKFKHEYAGAMNFYLNYLKAEETDDGENPPIGLILCSDKNETHVEYALGGLSNRVFVSRYLLNLPTQEELKKFLQRARKKLEK
jgi:predicted nuclease of restriction endonuclease-like (RecB) superfamily